MWSVLLKDTTAFNGVRFEPSTLQLLDNLLYIPYLTYIYILYMAFYDHSKHWLESSDTGWDGTLYLLIDVHQSEGLDCCLLIWQWNICSAGASEQCGDQSGVCSLQGLSHDPHYLEHNHHHYHLHHRRLLHHHSDVQPGAVSTLSTRKMVCSGSTWKSCPEQSSSSISMKWETSVTTGVTAPW